jgi:outer membrane protein assembly factor BamD (BamD/ComL family)
MRKTIIAIALALFVFSLPALAQTQEDERPQLPLDQILEADASHNLDVAWQYFKRKKAYKAVLMRTDETIAAHPLFTKIDEVLYLAGMSSYYLSIGKGKQQIKLDLLPEEDRERYTPEQLREDSATYLTQLVEDHPDSKYRDEAVETLKKLKLKD